MLSTILEFPRIYLQLLIPAVVRCSVPDKWVRVHIDFG